MFSEAGENLREVRGRLALAQNHLGHAGAQAAVMINFGKTEIFEGKMAQAVDGVVGGQLATTDLIEKFADGFSVHGRALSGQQSAFSLATLD